MVAAPAQSMQAVGVGTSFLLVMMSAVLLFLVVFQVISDASYKLFVSL